MLKKESNFAKKRKKSIIAVAIQTRILYYIHYMNNLNKVKKWLDRKQELGLIDWKYWLINLETGDMIESHIKTTKYKLKLSNNKEFMKKWTDMKLNLKVTENLRQVDLWFLYILQSYTDKENIIDFRRFKKDYEYTDSKLSKSKKPLLENMIIKQDDYWIIYLNPLIWIKSTDINQELIDLFKDSFEKYWVDINY